jgi:hypothetical protein
VLFFVAHRLTELCSAVALRLVLRCAPELFSPPPTLSTTDQKCFTYGVCMWISNRVLSQGYSTTAVPNVKSSFNLSASQVRGRVDHLKSEVFTSFAGSARYWLGLTPLSSVDWESFVDNHILVPSSAVWDRTAAGCMFQVINVACYQRLLRVPAVELIRMRLSTATTSMSGLLAIPTPLNGYVHAWVVHNI